MANNLRRPIEVSPSVRDTNEDGVPDLNVVGAAFGTVKGTDWVSEWVPVEATEHGSEELSVMCHVDWQGAASIDLLPQFRHQLEATPQDPKGQVREPGALPLEEFDGARLDSTFGVELDTVTLQQAQFRTDPGAQELALAVAGVSEVRFLARAVGGSPVLRMQILSGGGWRGA